MSTRGTIRLATRGSALARRQTASIREPLEDRRWDVEVVEVETTGDQLDDELIHRLGKTGAFVRALDQAVLDGDADMPTEQPEGLITAGIPERAAANDALVTPDGATLEELPEGGVVGTSSLRRTAQLLAARPDLEVVPLRGNVDTRVEKLLAPHRQREHEARLEAAEEDEDRYERTPE
ncbi:MAG: porphobilinogen deaminase, partial [Actinobacteria bacterium]|nr:porphobilinogen deaminase [Actinomycetota bacterium]NIU65545.1 porphobilinogen deaminase [Actinomycetota bacterium]NIW27361.1 porphobilinogen deaminase [Actinomycetota bacterium]NIX19888.1 porphobilinogen deaminase [Actinomycetota bacterium]